jgi:tetratricopeptide (TPR) repeat protein
MRRSLTILFFLISLYSFSQSQKAEKNIQAGNDYYKQQQFGKAAEAYNKAIEAEPANQTAKFNQANTLYKQDKKEEATQRFAEVANEATVKELRSKAFYNKGVILSRQKNLKESIAAYKNTLRLNPDDKEARENLQKALLELKKKNQPKKKEEQDKKKKQQKQSQSKMSPKEALQRLQLLAQKEKEVQQRIQREKSKPGGNQTKDW